MAKFTLFGKVSAYRRLFLNAQGDLHPDAAIVLNDLANLCGAHKSSLRNGQNGVDPYATLYAEGRREAWLRIFTMLNVDERKLMKQLQAAQQHDDE